MGSLLRFILLAATGNTAFMSMGQMTTLSGTQLTIDPGTSLRVDVAGTWNVDAGSTVTNNGTITLGADALLNEAGGSPIDGTGTERITRTIDAPPNSENIGGLGLRITTSIALGNTSVERGHLPFTDYSGHVSIERWYRVEPAVNSGLNATIELVYDPSELGALPEESLVSHIRATTDVWLYLPSAVNTVTHIVSSSLLDSLGTFTTFDSNLPNAIADLPSNASYLVISGANGERELRWSDDAPQKDIVLMDASGRMVRNWRRVSRQGSLDLHTEELAPGAYIVHINGSTAIPFVR